MSQGNTPVSARPAGDEASGPILHELIRRGRSFSGRERHCCFLNLHDGRFADISAASGLDLPDDGRGAAQVDWDRDGDLDFWISNRNGPQLRFLRNDIPRKANFVTFRLEGKRCNRDAVGARLELSTTASSSAPLLRTVRAGDGFLAQSSKRLHFGLGDQEVEEVVVRWPGGNAETFSGIDTNAHYRLVQDAGEGQPLPVSSTAKALQPVRPAEPASSAALQVFSASMLPLPRIGYRSFSGQPKDIAPAGARTGPVLLNLWASWCGPCVAELKEWTQHENELRTHGLRIVALSVDKLDSSRDGENAAEEITRRLGFPFETGFADATTVEKLQLVHNHLFDAHHTIPVPTSILIDADGQIAAFYRGRVPLEVLEADLSKLSTDLRTRVLASTPFSGWWHFHRRGLNPLDLIWKWTEQGFVEEAVDYIERHADILAEHYNFPKLLVLTGNGLLGRGNAARAIAYYRQALEILPEYADAQNNLAWLLATHADDALRNAEEAVKLAEMARATQGDSASVLDTLAAAYAEAKRFEEAVATASEAIHLARSSGQTQLTDRLQQRLELYQRELPYRAK